MKIAIIGLPNSGKTTVFNALTGGAAETAAFSSGRVEPNLAAVRVPDARVDALSRIYNPRKTTYAEVQYVDIGGFQGSEARRDTIPPEIMTYIGTADAFLHVVRCFENPEVPHPLDSVDPARDISRLDQELILSDLVVVERRLERLEKDIRKVPAAEKPIREAEQKILQRFQEALSSELPLREVWDLTAQEEKLLKGFQFLTAKPVLVVLNLGEDQLQSPPTVEYNRKKSDCVALGGKIEAELAQLSPEDAAEFLEHLGIDKPARDKVIAASYRLLGYISFLTVGEDEVRAWTIPENTKAPEAGGAIHSDIERGFIRAEVVNWEQLVRAGSLAAAKKHGVVRLEGRDYVVQDGDVSHFLFNV